MMNKTDDRQAPPEKAPARLLDHPGEASRVLAEANEQYRQGLDEARAWHALEAAQAGRRRRPILIPVGVGLAIAAAGIVLVLARANHERPAVVKAPPAAKASPPSPATPVASPIRETAARVVPPVQVSDPRLAQEPSRTPAKRLRSTPVRYALPEGRSVLADGSEISLSKAGKAEVNRATKETTSIALLSGAVELHVAPQHESTFDVVAGNVTFRVVGTRFRVVLTQEQPELEVSEGTVAVLDGGRLVARVTAGGRWSARASAEALAPPHAAPEPLVPRQPAQEAASKVTTRSVDDCLSVARHGGSREAIACLQPVGAGVGLSAEMAMYEIARLQRDVLGDAQAALGTLQAYTARFPQGSLQAEARLSEIDILARLGRTQEALAASGHLLSLAAGRERAADLHLLRGNLLREKAADCEQAIREYAKAEENRGAVGAEALLGRALCLESQGRTDEAVAAYRACLNRGHGRSASEARRRLEALGR